MSLSGETIDYGPCAFLDEYVPSKSFSSIDHNGRYSYLNQPNIGSWNLARFAETSYAEPLLCLIVLMPFLLRRKSGFLAGCLLGLLPAVKYSGWYKE